MDSNRTPVVVAVAIVGGIATGIAVTIAFFSSPHAALLVLVACIGLTAAFAALATGSPASHASERRVPSQQNRQGPAVVPNARVGNAIAAGAIALGVAGALVVGAVMLFVMAFLAGLQQG
jgi:hypothetical protein